MSQNSRNQGFSNYRTYICLMIEGSGSRTGSGSGSIPLTNGSGSGRPKNTWIRKPWKNVVFACRSCAHHCRATHLGGEGGADGGGAAGYVLIAA
jgi:hypothetical protein